MNAAFGELALLLGIVLALSPLVWAVEMALGMLRPPWNGKRKLVA